MYVCMQFTGVALAQ